MYHYTCPTCKKMTEVARRENARFRPFCSHRCKMIDLGHWFNETYRISEPLTGASEYRITDSAETGATGHADQDTIDAADSPD